MSDLNSCYCCEGLSVQVPALINNRNGLSAVAYRVGTHPQFKQSLLARLSIADQPSLKNFTTRNDADFSIALLDAWSVIADILTFYQERIINESFLQTATERFSVLELARLIGYELRPGVAAVSYIAFTLEDSSSALGPILPSTNLKGLLQSLPPITIDGGIKIQSVPAPGEKAQIFETVESISARAEWNNIKVRLTQPQVLNKQFLLVNAVDNNLKKGSPLLINTTDVPFTTAPLTTNLSTVVNTTIDFDAKTTKIDLIDMPSLPGYAPQMPPSGEFGILLKPVLLMQSSVNYMAATRWKESDLSMLISANKWSAIDVYKSINSSIQTTPQPSNTSEPGIIKAGAYAFRKRAAIFGYNALHPLDSKGVPLTTDWSITDSIAAHQGNIYLDAGYEEILAGSYIALQKPGATSVSIYQVTGVNISPRTEYGISGKTTQLSLSPADAWWPATASTLSDVRSTSIYIQSEQLPLADLPVVDDILGDTVLLDRYYPGLNEGQAIILSGERKDLQGVTSSELMFLKEVNVVAGFTELIFKTSLGFSYVRKTVTINANVAKATHGESVQEVLGSGDASQIFQTFTLKQPPLTFVTADSDSGTQSTLEIRVNNLLWQEVSYFLDHGANERIYITRQDNNGNTTVTFGDGINGARVPTGQQNIKAKYRKGIGAAGMIKANQLSQLQTKPLGIKSAINPVAANGAQDAEQLESARTNAALTILTLGRVVSLQDYEDFARAFAGIEKSLATWTLLNGTRHIFITVAGSGGAEVLFGDNELGSNLLAAIRKAGDSKVPITINSYTPRFFQVSASLIIDKDYLYSVVLANVEQNLRDTFSFQARNFAQPVSFSEVISCMQQIPGVIAVDIKLLFRSEDPTKNITGVIPAAMPVIISATNVIGAELLTLDPRPVDLTVTS